MAAVELREVHSWRLNNESGAGGGLGQRSLTHPLYQEETDPLVCSRARILYAYLALCELPHE